jgi:diguanylate cyclase (GGDEF)-like protein
MIDVDHFKAFNEEEGHDAGDDVLRAVAEAIKASVRPYDLAARYGGEEFCVIVPNSDRETLQVISDRIRRRVAAASHHTRSGRDRHITVSIGAAEYPSSANDAPSLLKAADQALFRAKREGRDRMVFFDGDSGSGPSLEPDLKLLFKWLTKRELQDAKRTDALIAGYIEQISLALRLTPTQTHLLRALAIIAPAYQHAKDGDAERSKAMEEAEEIRTLLPSLHGLSHRYDGRERSKLKGTRIPLLSRILAVLLALERENGQPLVDDPGKFDPEVVSVVAELHPAA